MVKIIEIIKKINELIIINEFNIKIELELQIRLSFLNKQIRNKTIVKIKHPKQYVLISSFL